MKIMIIVFTMLFMACGQTHSVQSDWDALDRCRFPNGHRNGTLTLTNEEICMGYVNNHEFETVIQSRAFWCSREWQQLKQDCNQMTNNQH